MPEYNSGTSAHQYLAEFLIGKINYSFLGVTKDSIINSGFYHLFVISGFHIGLIFLILYRLILSILLLCYPYKNYRLIATLISLVFCLYYIYLCNFPLSAIRALTIISIYNICRHFHIRPNNFNCLIILFGILIILNPKVINNPGFWFSFSNSLALIYYFSYQSHDLINAPRTKLLDLYRTSLICFFASVPITLIFFHKIQFAGIFSNVLAVPYFIFILFPLSIIAYLSHSDILVNLAIFTHKIFANFAVLINKIPHITLDVLLIDKIEIAILISTCFLIIKSRLQNYLLAMIILLVTISDTKQAQQDILILNSIPRSITLKNNLGTLPILTSSKFSNQFNCDIKECSLNYLGNKIIIIKNTLPYRDFLKHCLVHDLIINLSSNNYTCYSTLTITALDLYFKKRILIFLEESSYHIIYP
ncbi:MAG: ComEC/Rec2 family competence protein [Rickettsiales bacterium]|nr:ComEC/Rec2 family competence protein [Rickettsiales bacterium]